MEYIVRTLRRDTFLRVGMWILLSVVFGTCGLFITLTLCVLVMPFIAAEAYGARALVVLIAELIALSIPAIMLKGLSKNYPKVPLIHFVLAVVAWLFLTSTGLFILAFALLQLGLWAELVGVYWQERLR